MAFGRIIREKQRFPVDKFGEIQDAFPCVIAGLRDYAEFIPLERGLFDLVIIDEASQVSIAQALPAIVRAKKVLVLGDRNQFGNVKTSNASQEVNAAYMQDLIKAFTEDFANVSQIVRTKIDLFNIRSSVLDFIEPISNFAIQLKKHFRSYPEMISFSSKYFYDDSLQVMKIRGKPIEDVIEFDPIDHDGLIDQRNVNAPEAERIVERILELLDVDPSPSIGVITPHTEQQAFLAKLVSDHPRSEEFFDRLRLKIMTFDTCQGEEREIVFYSLVATDFAKLLMHGTAAPIDLPGANTRDAFKTIGLGCLKQVINNEPALIKGDAEGVHQMRVGLRRMGAGMSLFAVLLGDRQTAAIKAELKWLAGELGPARELEVLVNRVVAPMKRQRRRWGGMPSLSREIAERRDAALTRAQDTRHG
jgi:CHAD domain/AAA domain